MKSRVLKNGKNQITQGYSNSHKAVDLVKYKAETDYIIAHSDGVVVEVVKNYNKTDKTGNSYGNYVKIRHTNGYFTLYAHLKYKSVTVSVGNKVKEGQLIGYMGNTGHSNGAHLHFEVRNKNNGRINPTPYLNSDLPSSKLCEYRVYNNDHWYAIVSDGAQAGNTRDKKGIGGIQFKNNGFGYSIYQVYDNTLKKWLDEVCLWNDSDNGYAGFKGHEMGAFRIKVENAKVKYRGYDGTLNKWLPWVTGYSLSDANNGYAGIKGHKLLAIEVKII